MIRMLPFCEVRRERYARPHPPDYARQTEGVGDTNFARASPSSAINATTPPSSVADFSVSMVR
jgi:hypothetical protein